MSASLASLGVQSQGILGTRGTVQATASYILSDIATNGTLTSGSIRTADLFDIQANGYAAPWSPRTMLLTRSVEDLRREIVSRLTMFLQRHAATAKS